MLVQIYDNNRWRDIEIDYPYQAASIRVPLVGGASRYQRSPYEQYDIRIPNKRGRGSLTLYQKYRLKINGIEHRCILELSQVHFFGKMLP
jgi:hypothetical protein